MNTVCSMAPGKIILFGEHFVVKGKPAIASAVNLYARVYIYPGKGHVLESKQLRTSIDLDKPINEFKQFKILYEIISRETGVDKGFKAVIDSDIPIAAGMGSSAATSVAFTHALLTYYGVKPSLDLVNKIAYEAEKVVHGKPSGIDNTISTYGGIIYYKSGVFKRIETKWPDNAYLVVVDTGVKRNTGIIVHEVLKLYDKHSDILSLVYDAAEALVEKAYKLLVKNEIRELGDLILINQGLLTTLGLSIRESDNVFHFLREIGALGAKISGAGRGGIVYGLFIVDDKEALMEKLERMSYRYYVVRPIYEGVKYCH